jgi:hypothetical protein
VNGLGAGDRALRGWLREQKAAYLHLTDRAAAERALAGALDDNPFVLRPVNGGAPVQLKAAAVQSRAAAEFLATQYRDGVSLSAGEVAAGLGDPAVGDHDHHVRSVDRAAGAVQHLEFGSAHGCAPLAEPAVLALDHPAPPQRIGRLHVRSQVALAAYLHGVGAAVAAHQIPDRVLELPVSQHVKLKHLV